MHEIRRYYKPKFRQYTAVFELPSTWLRWIGENNIYYKCELIVDEKKIVITAPQIGELEAWKEGMLTNLDFKDLVEVELSTPVQLASQ
jgi:hypothetical protein